MPLSEETGNANPRALEGCHKDFLNRACAGYAHYQHEFFGQKRNIELVELVLYQVLWFRMMPTRLHTMVRDIFKKLQHEATTEADYCNICMESSTVNVRYNDCTGHAQNGHCIELLLNRYNDI